MKEEDPIINFKKNTLSNIKWFEPKLVKKKGKTTTHNVIVFGSEFIDNNWMRKQYKYWKQLKMIDKMYLFVYTSYGDVLLNIFLSKGVKGIDVQKILDKDYYGIINPFFPLFIEYINKKWFCDDKYDITLINKFLNENISLTNRYKHFCEFFKTLDKKILKKKIGYLMRKFNENINRIINNSPDLTNKMLVARGSTDKLSYDDIWTNGFTSTSISFRSAMRFAVDLDLSLNGFVDIYVLQPGTPCIPIFHSKYKQELEILLGSGCCKYEILKKNTMKNVQNKIMNELQYINKNFIYSSQKRISVEQLLSKTKKDITIRYYEVSPSVKQKLNLEEMKKCRQLLSKLNSDDLNQAIELMDNTCPQALVDNQDEIVIKGEKLTSRFFSKLKDFLQKKNIV